MGIGLFVKKQLIFGSELCTSEKFNTCGEGFPIYKLKEIE